MGRLVISAFICWRKDAAAREEVLCCLQNQGTSLKDTNSDGEISPAIAMYGLPGRHCVLGFGSL